MSRKKINDGLNKFERYRLKDVEAYRKKKRDWARTPEQRGKRNAYQRIWKDKNRSRANQLARESYQRNKHKHKARNHNCHLKRTFGITLETYEKLLLSQNNMCAICKGEVSVNTKRRFPIDHCHRTGNIRGILCFICNTKLGWYERFEEAIKAYLEKK